MTLIKSEKPKKEKENKDTDKIVSMDKKRASDKVKDTPVEIEDIYKYPVEIEDIITACRETSFGYDIPKINLELLYNFGNQENSPEKKLDLEVKLDYNKGHAIKLFGFYFSKSGIKQLFDSFTTIQDCFLKEMYNVIEKRKEEFMEQTSMFPELEKASLSSMEINLPIYNHYEDDIIPLKLNVAGYNAENLCIKLSNKQGLNRCDLYYLYHNFDNIMNKILNNIGKPIIVF